MDDELNHSIQLRDREALELVFGVPLPVSPFLWRNHGIR